ncbi:hypothetical protein SPRG_03889 [Saprolegnia parasitica CBS 223.65]|uniref:BZIP domain-containing protein n=1 Tax=Saprolegnia parasitica (strain CBS 223.65) TaxID=695850 RepID=A0A067CKN8_SAPPC|nr:hypothetical protein SPRG_03889 [Saprolegnia parasitica CBS 223.65]KDO31274.1 hypothetical protein SPRG_03889 [Saprolegnia parasitica CBS 223.65]|eukprot:XP_012197873.1 hypothetical protein SPRG_03889 [Saprolegnia parasitica CBS 223.65]
MFLQAILGRTLDEREVRYRQRSQTNQRRYRQRKKVAHARLEHDVLALRCANDALTNELRMAQGVCVVHERATRVAHDYYTLFEHGLQAAAIETQRAYLRSAMSPNLVVMGDTRVDGATKLLEQLHFYTTLFDAHHLRLEHVNVVVDTDDDVVVKTIGLLSLRLSRRSVATLYPNLVGADESTVQHLLGRVIQVQMVSHFYISKTTGLVEELISSANTVLAAVNLLEDITQSQLALQSSALRPTGELVVDDSILELP